MGIFELILVVVALAYTAWLIIFLRLSKIYSAAHLQISSLELPRLHSVMTRVCYS